MEAGQGKLDFKIKKFKAKGEIVEPIAGTITDTPGIKIINFDPRITWKKNLLPTKIPPGGLHGGIIFKKHEEKMKDGSLGELHREVFIPNIGYGSGNIVHCGTGSVLMGASSFVSLTSVFLPWIVILLLTTAILWAIRIYIARHSKRPAKTKFYHMKENNEGNWIEEAIENDLKSSSRDASLLNGNTNFQNERPVIKRLIMSEQDQRSQVASLSSFGHSVRPNAMRSFKGSTVKKASNDSVLSYTSSVVGSVTFGPVYVSQAQCIERKNQVAIGCKTGMVYTVSEKGSPNSYWQENLQELSFCKESNYDECVELFFLYDEKLLVAKMKSQDNTFSVSPFVVQIWSTVDGAIQGDPDHILECTCICPVMDIYLAILSGDFLSVVDLNSNTCVSQIRIPFSKRNLPSMAISMQITRDMNHIVITEFVSTWLSIYVYKFDDVQRGSTNVETYSGNATSFAIISSTKIIIALNSNEVILWDFATRTDNFILESTESEIIRLLSSPTGHLASVQFITKVSVFQTKDWSHIYNIPVFSEQVCAMVFSSEIGGYNLLATSLDNGIIQIYNSFNGQLIRTITIDKPVTFLLFYETGPYLLAVSDRASHYQLSAFSVS